MADCGPTLIRPSSRHDVSGVCLGINCACDDGPEQCQCWATFSYIALSLTRRRVGFDVGPQLNDARPTSNQHCVNSLCLFAYNLICNGSGSLIVLLIILKLSNKIMLSLFS